MAVSRKLVTPNTEIVEADYSDDTSIAAAGTQTKTLIAPSGYIYEIMFLKLYYPAPAGAASGTHKVNVYQMANANLELLYGLNDFNANIRYNYGQWYDIKANNYYPDANHPSNQLDIIKGQVVDDTNGIQFKYTNDTDVAAALEREVIACVKKIKVR